jgi:hypothetical protein
MTQVLAALLITQHHRSFKPGNAPIEDFAHQGRADPLEQGADLWAELIAFHFLGNAPAIGHFNHQVFSGVFGVHHQQAMAGLLIEIGHPAPALGRIQEASFQGDTEWYFVIFSTTATTIAKQLPTTAKTRLTLRLIKIRLS